MKLAAAYIRVSTDMQVEYSPDSQLRLIQDYAKAHQFIIPEKFVFMELGISGRHADKRPSFQKMISLAKEKQFEAILIYHTNRFARNHEESIIYKSMLKRDCDIDVISITQPPVDRKTDMLTNAIYSVMDEWYSIDLSANVKRGMTEKAMRGGYQCSPPFGYRIPGYRQTPVIVEEEAKVVRIVFDMYLSGTTSLWNIGKTLTESGFRTRRGNPWTRRAIEYMITNPVYKGLTVWNKRSSNKSSFNDRSEWITAAGDHEPIISPEEFDKVQEIYYKNKPSQKAKPCGTYSHWLSGLLKCAACSRSLTYSRGKYDAFACNGYKKGLCTKCNSLSRKKSEAIIFDITAKISNNIYLITFEHIVHKPDKPFIEIESLKEKLLRLDRKLQRFKEAYSAGYDTLEEYGENKKSVFSEKTEIESKISSLQMSLQASLEMENPDENSSTAITENTKSVYGKLFSQNISVEDKAYLIRSLISKIIYDKSKNSLQVFFNF